MRLQVLAALIGLTTVAPASAADMTPPARRSPDLPPPRDPDIAVREEYEAARRANTVAAYDLFIARHPEHRLAEAARRESARLPRHD